MFSTQSQSKASVGRSSMSSTSSLPRSPDTSVPKSPQRSSVTYGAVQSTSLPPTAAPAATSLLTRIWGRTASTGVVLPPPAPTKERQPSPANSLTGSMTGSMTGTGSLTVNQQSSTSAYRPPRSPPMQRRAEPKQSPTVRTRTPERYQPQFPTSTTAQATTAREKDYRRAPFVCEFLGTAALAFTVTCCKFGGNSMWNSLAIGCAFMALIYAVGPTSGGNLNPAVSLTLALLGKLRWPVAAGYILIQTMGALMGTNIAKIALFANAKPRFLVAPVAPFRLREACEVEALFTTMLCFVVANCVVSQKNNPARDQNQFYGLAIGFSIIAGGYAVEGISGAIFNPALAISLNSPDIKEGVAYGFEYAAVQMLGACLAAALYYMCRPSSEDEAEEGRQPLTVPQHSLATRIASEFIGTFFLCVTVGFCYVLNCPATPIAAAAALMSMVYSVGRVSGGHFNPAVTCSVVLSGRDKCDVPEGCLYIVVQFLAGIASGVLVAFVHGFVNQLTSQAVLSNMDGHAWSESFAAELVFTMLLAYVVLTVTTSAARPSATSQNFYFGLAIGACYIMGGFSVRNVSGGVLNPAIATGIATDSSLIVSFSKLWKPHFSPVQSKNMLSHQELQIGPFGQIANWFQFTVAELMGGALASALFGLTHPQEFDNLGKAPLSSRYRDSDAESGAALL